MARYSVLTLAVAGVALLLGVSAARADAAGDEKAEEKVQEWTYDVAIEEVLPLAKSESSGSNFGRAHGMAVCTLSVSNISAVTRTVRLFTPPDTVRYQQECTVAPGASVLVRFNFLPAAHTYGGALMVEIDGAPKGFLKLSPFPRGFSGKARQKHSTILSPSISQVAVKYRAQALFPKPEANLKQKDSAEQLVIEGGFFLDGQRPVAEWPAQWLAYTLADCIVLTKDEWETAPPGVRDALLGFLQAGGHLFLAGAGEADLERYAVPVGFGALSALSSPVPEEWTEDDFESLREAVVRSGGSLWRFLLQEGRTFPTERLFPLPRLIPVYVVLFCVMILLGPVLLVVLARRNIRIRIYWLAPGIAGAVSAVILACALARDGVSPVTHAQSVLYVSGKAQTHVQLATLSIMAPAGLSSPLHFGPSVEVTPTRQGGDGAVSGVRTVRSDGADTVLSSGWVGVRVPITFLLRDAGVQGVPALSPDASATVTNPYPVPIRKLLYCDAESNCFVLDAPLAPGATVSLTPCPGVSGTMLDVVEDVKHTFFSGVPLDEASGAYLALPPKHLLPPKMYLCELEGTPFLQHPLRKGSVRHTGKTLMLGELP